MAYLPTPPQGARPGLPAPGPWRGPFVLLEGPERRRHQNQRWLPASDNRQPCLRVCWEDRRGRRGCETRAPTPHPLASLLSTLLHMLEASRGDSARALASEPTAYRVPRARSSMRVKDVPWLSTRLPPTLLNVSFTPQPPWTRGREGRSGWTVRSCLPASPGVGGDLQVTRQKVGLVLFLMSKNRSFEASWNF